MSSGVMGDSSQVTKPPHGPCFPVAPLTPIRSRGTRAGVGRRPDGRSIPLVHNPLEFVSTPCFERDTRDKDPDGRTGGAAGLDVLDEHL